MISPMTSKLIAVARECVRPQWARISAPRIRRIGSVSRGPAAVGLIAVGDVAVRDGRPVVTERPSVAVAHDRAIAFATDDSRIVGLGNAAAPNRTQNHRHQENLHHAR